MQTAGAAREKTCPKCNHKSPNASRHCKNPACGAVFTGAQTAGYPLQSACLPQAGSSGDLAAAVTPVKREAENGDPGGKSKHRRVEGAGGGASSGQVASTAVLLAGRPQLGQYAESLRKQEFCDIKIEVGERRFHAHRVVLAAHSKFLATLVKDRQAGEVVKITDMEAKVFGLVLAFVYHGKCAVQTDLKSLEAMLTAAARLQVEQLRSVLVEILRGELTPETCARVLACAARHGLPDLEKEAMAVAKKHFVEVASKPDLPAATLLTLLKSDELDVKTEVEVFETVVRWIRGQTEPVSDKEQLDMFAAVRFALIPKDFDSRRAQEAPSLATLPGQMLLLDQFQDASRGCQPRARRAV